MMLFKWMNTKKEKKVFVHNIFYLLQNLHLLNSDDVKNIAYYYPHYVFEKEQWKIDIRKVYRDYEIKIFLRFNDEYICIYEIETSDCIIKFKDFTIKKKFMSLYYHLHELINEQKEEKCNLIEQTTPFKKADVKMKKNKKMTIYELFEEVSLLAEYKSSFIEELSVHSFILKKDNWEIRILREHHNEYVLTIDLYSIRICEIKGRNEELDFLVEGTWIDGFYSFYQTFPSLLKEAKYLQFYTLRYKKEWSLPLEESVIPPAKTKKIAQLWSLAKGLHELKSPYVKSEPFDTFHLYHKDFFVQIIRWNLNNFTLKVFVEFPQEERIKIIDMYGKDQSFSFRFEGVWEKYFVSFLSLLEEEYEKRQREKEEKIKKALHS